MSVLEGVKTALVVQFLDGITHSMHVVTVEAKSIHRKCVGRRWYFVKKAHG